MNGHPFTIVGVTPAAFPGPQLGTVRNLYVPMMMQAIMRPPRAQYSGEQNPDLLRNNTNSWLFGVGRLKSGVGLEHARAALEGSASAYVRTLPQTLTPPKIPLLPIDEGDPGQRQQMQSVAWLLGGVVGAVLLIGASRARVVRQLLTESVVLSLMGGVCGVALAWSDSVVPGRAAAARRFAAGD